MSRRQSVVGKVVVVTGAARGIGAATAAELARRGARLSLVGLEPDRLRATTERLGPGHVWFDADVTDQPSLDAAVAGTVDRLGGIDAVIANAGIANYGTIRTADPKDFDRTVAVNLVGVYRTLSATVPHLVARRGYALVVASTASFTPLPGSAAYAASKAGAESLAATMRAELASYGVDVGSAHPLWIDTDMVRGAEAALPTFQRMRRELPWPANGTVPVAECAAALADGVERRARRVYVPRTAALVAAVRPLLLSGVLQRGFYRRSGKDLRQLDAENQALGATWR